MCFHYIDSIVGKSSVFIQELKFMFSKFFLIRLITFPDMSSIAGPSG